MVKEFKTVLIPHISATKLKKDNGTEVSKEQRKYMNDNSASGSRKPHQRKRTRTVDCASQGIFKSGLASKPNRSYSVKRMKPLHINEFNKGKGILEKVSEDQEDDSGDEFIELNPQPDKKGKGPANEMRADLRTYSAAGGSMRRNIDNMRGNKVITFRPGPRPNISSSPARLQPLQINEMDNRGKGILDDTSDKDSDSYDWNVKALKNVKISKRIGCFGKELFESGEIPLPSCKYFVTKIKNDRMNKLHIPKDILLDSNLQLPEQIELVDPAGDTYTCCKVNWTDGRTFYQGMGRLCRNNHLTEDDVCICEFGEGDESGYLFINFVCGESSRYVGRGWEWAK